MFHLYESGTILSNTRNFALFDRLFSSSSFSPGTIGFLVTAQTVETMRALLQDVVGEGTGKNAQVEGYAVGGKTATSEKLPRGNGKYISSFLGFAPADDPQIMGLVLIDEPVGVYYGGTIAAPVMAEIFENILPYYLGE